MAKSFMKPTNVKVLVWILDDHVSEFLDGNYDVVWCEERKDLSGTWNHFTQLSIEPTDFIKLKVARGSTFLDSNLNEPTNQLKIPFSYE